MLLVILGSRSRELNEWIGHGDVPVPLQGWKGWHSIWEEFIWPLRSFMPWGHMGACDPLLFCRNKVIF